MLLGRKATIARKFLQNLRPSMKLQKAATLFAIYKFFCTKFETDIELIPSFFLLRHQK